MNNFGASTLHEQYLGSSVGNYLVAPAVPEAGTLVLNELVSREDIMTRSRVMHFDDGTGMALIDKQFAHAIREVMWLHAEDEPISTLEGYLGQDTDGSRAHAMFEQMSECAIEAERHQDYVALSWSSDPLTLHRPSIQGEKRLHFHLTSRNGELDALPDVTQPIAALSFIDRRRIAEEYAVASVAYLKDKVEAVPYCGDLDIASIHPCFLSLEIGDWQDLKSPAIIGKLDRFLTLANTEYTAVTSAFGGEDSSGFLKLDNVDDAHERLVEASGLDFESVGFQAMLAYLNKCRAGQLSFLSHGETLPDNASNDTEVARRLRLVMTPSIGMSYAGNFSRHNDVLYFNFRPTKFSDLGGAGCAILEGMPVRIKKGKDVMTDAQYAQRKAFVAQNLEVIAA